MTDRHPVVSVEENNCTVGWQAQQSADVTVKTGGGTARTTETKNDRKGNTSILGNSLTLPNELLRVTEGILELTQLSSCPCMCLCVLEHQRRSRCVCSLASLLCRGRKLTCVVSSRPPSPPPSPLSLNSHPGPSKGRWGPPRAGPHGGAEGSPHEFRQRGGPLLGRALSDSIRSQW